MDRALGAFLIVFREELAKTGIVPTGPTITRSEGG
jgi:hypothetical protein